MTTFYLPTRIPTREYPLNHLHYNKVLVMLIFWNWTLPRGIWAHQVFLLLTMKVLVLRHKICLKKPKSTFSKASQLALAALFMLTMYLAVLTTSIVLILEEITILYFFLTFRLTILDFFFLTFRLPELNIVTAEFFKNCFYVLIFNNCVLVINIISNLGECSAINAKYNIKKYW